MNSVQKYDIRSIGNRAKGLEPGEVRPEDVEFARQVLRSRSGDVYGALYVVGLCGEKRDAALLEGFLFGEENNIYAEVALKALCRYLGLVDKYRPLLRELIISPSDENGTRRMAAIHLMDRYFDNYSDDELGCHLVGILLDVNDDDRLSARNALADILTLRSALKDPHGLDFRDWDEDSDLLVETAMQRFKCRSMAHYQGVQLH